MSLRVSATEVRLGNAVDSAIRLNQLVEREDVKQIKAAQGAIERYGSFLKAVKNSGRLALARGFHAYVLGDTEQNNAPIGIGTVIQLDTNLGPDRRSASVIHDLSYWLCGSADESLHHQAGLRMVLESEKITQRQIAHLPRRVPDRASRFQYGMMFTEDPEQPEVARGLKSIIDKKIGEVAVLSETFNVGEDPYGVGMGDTPVQLYYKRREFTI